MRVAVFVHYYLPYRCAGSETMLHTMCKALLEAGHEVAVFATVMPEAPVHYLYEGVEVVVTNVAYGRMYIENWNPDVIVSHHDNTLRAKKISTKLGIPLVFLCHNNFDIARPMLDAEPDLVVFNTDWIKEDLDRPGMNSIVIHPPVFADQHRTDPGSKVTLVNLNRDKGAEIFYELARRHPEIEFLGVVGGHGEQIIHEDIPNVEIQNQTDDMKSDVWSKTAILLVPSKYESYGMAGVEALASGIPVIAAPTPGLQESQGENGIFLDRDDTESWDSMLSLLMNDRMVYHKASVNAYRRSNELDPASEMTMWVSEMERLVREHPDAS